MTGRALAYEALRLALSRKAEDPVLIDVRDTSGYTDYVLIVTARSERQVEAIADEVARGLARAGSTPLGVEGAAGAHWVLIDCADLVVHVFYRHARDFYDLEGLWADAPRLPIAGAEAGATAAGAM